MINISTVQYQDSQNTCCVVTQPDGSIRYVPVDPRNSDHQQILSWVAQGNSITAAVNG